MMGAMVPDGGLDKVQHEIGDWRGLAFHDEDVFPLVSMMM